MFVRILSSSPGLYRSALDSKCVIWFQGTFNELVG